MITIENNQWKAEINPKGAELSSLINKQTDREFLWQRDPKYWGRCAPILFPIIGGLKNDQYTLNGKTYTMGKHGFCRDAQFEVVEQTQQKAVFELTDSEETRVQYPYSFRLQVSFELNSAGLVNQFKILNRNEEPQYFCLGGHPAFNLPMENGLNFEDYQVQFEKEETAPLWYLENDLLAGKKENWLNQSNFISLKTELFDNDALIFHQLKSRKLTITSPKGKSKVILDLGTFPMFGIWTKEGGAPYLCIEPWYGVDDDIHTDGNFKNKWEMIQLSPKEEFKAWFAISGE